MPSTPGGLPYPAPGQVPDVPADIRDLAEAIDPTLTTHTQDIADLNTEVAALGVGRMRVDFTGSQPLTENATTKIEFNSLTYDDSSLWDAGNFQLVIPGGLDGLWVLAGSVSYAGDAGGRRSCDIQSNLGRLVSALASTESTGQVRYAATTMMELSAGDTVWITGFHSSGTATLDVLGSTTHITHFAATRIQL